jgi:hypothetical protein
MYITLQYNVIPGFSFNFLLCTLIYGTQLLFSSVQARCSTTRKEVGAMGGDPKR